MQKKYVVRLTDEERAELEVVARKLKGTSQKVKRAQILLKADVNGPGWTDRKIAEAFDCRVQTVEDVRRRLVERGFAETLNGPKRGYQPTPNILDGRQVAQVIAMRLASRRPGTPTGRCGSWRAAWSNWKSRIRLVMKPCVGC